MFKFDDLPNFRALSHSSARRVLIKATKISQNFHSNRHLKASIKRRIIFPGRKQQPYLATINQGAV